MNTTIEFTDSEATANLASPWKNPTRSSFEDRVLKPAYQDRRLRFGEGVTRFRIVPSIKPSRFAWCMSLPVLGYPGGRFIHPRIFSAGTRSAYDHAYQWLRENNPAALFSKTNREGIRLLTDKLCLFWVLVEDADKVSARLLLASDYDASRGGSAGLGHEIWKATRDCDETGAQVADAISPTAGVFVTVEKRLGKGAKFPAYSVRIGRQPAPIAPLLERMSAEERSVLTPLENVVQQLTEEEEWQCLAKVMAPEHVEHIRASIT